MMTRFAFTALLICFVFAGAASVLAEDEVNPDAQFLDQLATNGIPAAYGEILGALTDGAGDALKEGVKQGSPNLATLANQKVWRDKISAVAQAIGRLSSALDVGGKIYSEQYDEAAIAGALTLISEFAASEGGKALLQSYGITGPVVATALTSFTIWRESAKALNEATMGRQLESLYGTIENMTRSRGRTLGQGDPFPVSSENIEKVWKRILSDPSFRELFKVYMTNELQKEFPEPGFWDKVDAYVAEPAIAVAAGGGEPSGGYAAAHLNPDKPVTESTAAERLERVQHNRLMAQHAEIKQYVAGLVGWLNRAAKVQEQQVLARQALAAMKAKIESGGMTVDQYFAKIQKAIDMAGVAEAYLKTCMPAIEKATKEEDYETLSVHIKMSSDYVRDIVAWLPDSGPSAGPRKQLFDGLKASYKAAADGIRAMKRTLAQKIEKPKLPPPQPGQPAVPQEQVASAQDYYLSHFKPLIKPFDWGNNPDTSAVVSRMEEAIAEGNFGAPNGIYRLPEGKSPAADAILQAWQRQNWQVAFAGGQETLPVASGPAELSIAQYEKDLKTEIGKRSANLPDDISSLNKALAEQGAAIDAKWKEGNAMCFPSMYGKKPPEGETAEQAKARRAAGQAIMEDAKRASEALQPQRDRVAKMTSAWGDASRLAGQAVSAQVTSASMTHSDMSSNLSAMLAVAQQRGQSALDALTQISGLLKNIPLPPAEPGKPVDMAQSLKWLEDRLQSDSYTKLGSVKKPEESTLSSGLQYRLGMMADSLTSRSREIRKLQARAEIEALGLASAYEDGARQFDSVVAEHAEDIDEIRELISPTFLSQDDWRKRREAAPKAAAEIRNAANLLLDKAEQEAGNMEADAFWLKRVATNFQRLISTGQSYGVVEEYGSTSDGGALRVPQSSGEGVMVKVPFGHYLTDKEKVEALAEMRSVWTSTNVSKFADSLAPWLKEAVDRFFQELSALKGFGEENFLLSDSTGGTYALPVTASGLAKVQQMLNNLKPGTPEFASAFSSMPSIIPLNIAYNGGSTGTFRDVVVPTQSPLAAGYTAFRNKLKDAYAQHLQLAAQMGEQERQKAGQEARAKLPGLIATMRQRLQDAQKMIDSALALQPGDRAGIEQAYKRLDDFHTNTLTSEPYREMLNAQTALSGVGASGEQMFKDAGDVANQVGVMSGKLHEAKAKLKDLQNRPEDRSAELKEFYDRFKQAYESRNESSLMGLIADSWSAGDGTTVDDLREHFNNMFSVFNEIRLTVANIQAQKVGEGRWQVTYEITIKGRIFDNNIRHEEKSSVTEEVQLDARGGKIVKTLQGRFWYVQ